MKKITRIVLIFSALILLAISSADLAVWAASSWQDDPPEDLNDPISTFDESHLSEEEAAVFNAVFPRILVVDPNPEMQGIRNPPAPELAAALADTRSTRATFSITYQAAGTTDLWGASCLTFPPAAKTAFEAAKAIWANTIESSVPITISACWSNLGSSSILGYSGGGSWYRNFTGRPLANTWYQVSLANSFYGNDLDPLYSDMYITYNSNFSWYYGTDGNTPTGQFDLVTVAAHEIAHGLNFAGLMEYTNGSAEFGWGSGYPSIYETFMESVGGAKLTSYTNPSIALGSLVTSNNLWWNGTHANAANGGNRVKMYAPSTWVSGSSYAHLDYATFSGTPNSLMVYAVAPASSQHNPGEVTKGILKDMGWSVTPMAPPGDFGKTSPVNGVTGQSTYPTLTWGNSSGAAEYQYCTSLTENTCSNWASNGTSTSKTLSGLTSNTTYYWHVRAINSVETTYSDSNSVWHFTTRDTSGDTHVYLPLVLKD